MGETELRRKGQRDLVVKCCQETRATRSVTNDSCGIDRCDSSRAHSIQCFGLDSVAISNESDGLLAALRVDLFHHSVNVIFDGEFRQIQICGDFFVA